MNLITRYIVLELLKVFFVTLSIMTLFMMLFGVVQEAMLSGLGPIPVLRLIPYLLPNALRFAVPGTILFSVCVVYGRLSASNELVALKSLGISPKKVIHAGLILAFFISLTAVWLNDISVSWGRRGVNRIILQSVEEIAYGMLRTKRTFSTPKFSINVKRVEGHKLIRVRMIFHPSGDSSPIVITAQEAELRSNPQKNTLSVILTNSEFDIGDKAHGVDPGTSVYEIPLSYASRKGGFSDSHSELALRQIPDAIDLQQMEIERSEQSLAARAAYQMMTGDFESLTGVEWKNQQISLTYSKGRLFRLFAEPWRRWANGFSCFCFVLVGIPLAIRMRKADFMTSFFFCFLPILLFYYPLLIYGVERAKSGVLPPYSVWLGNVVMLAAGCWLMRKVYRY